MSHRTTLAISALAGATLTSVCGCPDIPTTDGSTSFDLKVLPERIDDTIPGQRCVLLITIEEDDPNAEIPVTVTATADGATTTVEHGTITAAGMAEVVVTMLAPEGPQPDDEGWPCSVTMRAARGAIVREVEVPIMLTSTEEDLLAPEAAAMLDLFVPWLAENRPELGIGSSTEWVGSVVKPHWLVVSHYLFLSEEWEAHISWHIMIAPHDWAKVELRRRFEEELPSMAFEIPSRSAPAPVVVNEIEPEGILWR
jgi:hypothetical protein